MEPIDKGPLLTGAENRGPFEARKRHCELSTIVDEVPVIPVDYGPVFDPSCRQRDWTQPIGWCRVVSDGESYGAAQTTRNGNVGGQP